MTGPELKRLRLRHGLTMKQLAALVPCHWGQVNKWEHGQRDIRPIYEQRLRALLEGTRHE